MIRREYQKLLPADAAEAFQARSFDVVEYVHRHLDSGVAEAMQDGRGRPVLYHGHCQQKTLGLDVEAVSLLRRLGYEVRSTNVECCGMAGSFAYKQEYDELSMRVGEDLQRQLEANGCNPGRTTPRSYTRTGALPPAPRPDRFLPRAGSPVKNRCRPSSDAQWFIRSTRSLPACRSVGAKVSDRPSCVYLLRTGQTGRQRRHVFGRSTSAAATPVLDRGPTYPMGAGPWSVGDGISLPARDRGRGT